MLNILPAALARAAAVGGATQGGKRLVGLLHRPVQVIQFEVQLDEVEVEVRGFLRVVVVVGEAADFVVGFLSVHHGLLPPCF